MIPFLFDGYNVYHAACKLSEEWAHITPDTLCNSIATDMQSVNAHGVVVFDGRRTLQSQPQIKPPGYVRLVYSGPGVSADGVIEKMIQDSTAPRRLTVVSSDRRIRRAARRRRAISLTAGEYLEAMLKRANRPPPPPREPSEKRRGVPEGELDQWLELFGMDPDDYNEDAGFGRGLL